MATLARDTAYQALQNTFTIPATGASTAVTSAGASASTGTLAAGIYRVWTAGTDAKMVLGATAASTDMALIPNVAEYFAIPSGGGVVSIYSATSATVYLTLMP